MIHVLASEELRWPERAPGRTKHTAIAEQAMLSLAIIHSVVSRLSRTAHRSTIGRLIKRLGGTCRKLIHISPLITSAFGLGRR